MGTWFFIFWGSLVLLFYSYIGYGILLYVLLKIKRVFKDTVALPEKPAFMPAVTFMVAAYNEEAVLPHKIANTLALDYPAEKLHIVFVTDGSTDGTNRVIEQCPRARLLYEPQRKGKTAAVNRAMQHVQTPIVVFSDANTLLNPEAVKQLVKHFADEQVGAVAGEKKIMADGRSGAEAQGEGMYWKYESQLKKWDAELYSVMGAAGELFAIRTRLYESIPADTILDDFVISFGVNRKGYKVMYEPHAYASETPSASLAEEYKRKVRISAGGFQAMGRLLPLLNVFRYPRITWQYVSHRVLRWTLAPLCLPLLLLANVMLVLKKAGPFYGVILMLQLLFYGAAFAGYRLALAGTRNRYLYIPFYFTFMNIAVFHGFGRFVQKRQSAVWERSQRSMLSAS